MPTIGLNDHTVISVVIPTYNRLERLRRVVQALADQVEPGPIEVVVVSDGSTDGTDEYLLNGQTPLPIIACVQHNAGPAAARNAGVTAATGDLILFLDDDVIPAPDLLARHRDAHARGGADLVVIGPMLDPVDADYSPWVAWEQHQLAKQYEAMRLGTWEPTFRQFFTGNASVPRQKLLEVGLFDVSLRRGEDVELAYRLDQAGLRFEFEPDAKGAHHAERSFRSWLDMANDYGRNDAKFSAAGQDWIPSAIADEFRGRNWLLRAVTMLSLHAPISSRLMCPLLTQLGTSARMPSAVQRCALSALYGITYYGGLADGLGSRRALIQLLTTSRQPGERPLRVGLVLEQTLGHVTHSDNLRGLIVDAPDMSVVVMPINFAASRWAALNPAMRNWTVRAGIRARRAVRREYRGGGLDVMLVHTQVPAVLLGPWMRRIPTVVSLDATPEQYDQLGAHYSHARSSDRIEAVKKAANRRCFDRARHLVTWSDWAKAGLVASYGIDADKISVVPPGVHVKQWERGGPAADPPPLRLLFVGADLDRKGGRALIDVCRHLRCDPTVPAFELHLVTRTDVAPEAGIVVHTGLGPNSRELIDLYHASHVFCLPTLGDCLPMVLSEAGTTGMALLSTDVGAIAEIVRDGVTGLLVPPGDPAALESALRRLITDDDMRERLGHGAKTLVRQRYDASINAERLVEILRAAAGAGG